MEEIDEIKEMAETNELKIGHLETRFKNLLETTKLNVRKIIERLDKLEANHIPNARKMVEDILFSPKQNADVILYTRIDAGKKVEESPENNHFGDANKKVYPKEELLPCPFCGGKATLNDLGGSFSVSCESELCLVSPRGSTCAYKDHAVYLWNNRATMNYQNHSAGDHK